jgi:hypothetical protein
MTIWRRFTTLLMGEPGGRPFTDRAVLLYLWCLGAASMIVWPFNVLIGLPGPWGLVLGGCAVQAWTTWGLFRFRKVDTSLAAFSLTSMAAWTSFWYFMSFDGFGGTGSGIILAVAAPAVLMVQGRQRAAVIVAMIATAMGMAAVWTVFPDWISVGYATDSERRFDQLSTLFMTDGLLVVLLVLYSRQYDHRVRELDQERLKVQLLLASVVPERDQLAEQVRIGEGLADIERASSERTRAEVGAYVGRYRLVRELGKGATATVYLALHSELGTQHAIKVVDSPSRSTRARLMREGHAQAALKCPHIAAVTDTVVVGGMVGLVMDFQNGGTLAQRMRKGPLPLVETRELGRQLLEGLASAHMAGVVHRDLKPANVLLHRENGKLLVRIADFGLVKLLHEGEQEDLTATGGILGTPAYMAPEQVSDASRVDPRADLWSAGCILYEMLSGEKAFSGPMLQLFHHAGQGQFSPLNDSLPSAMRKVVASCLIPEREARAQTAAELLEGWSKA